MNQNNFEESYCGECKQPLFLNKQECLDWIENKLKQGYIVCQCCGAKQTLDEQT
jgi:hypothetical protein